MSTFVIGQRHKEVFLSFSSGPKYMFLAYSTRKGKEAGKLITAKESLER